MRTILLLAAVLLASCSEPGASATETSAASSSTDSVKEARDPITTAAFDSSTVKSLPLNQIPAGIPRLSEQMLTIKKWTDGNGPNMLVVTRTPARTLPVRPGDPNDTETVSLYARQYVQRAGRWQELWRVQDAVERCAFDTWLGLVPGATAITDLDADSQTETTLLYRLACRSDVSPARQKLIMREGAAKYALRGYSIVQYDSVPANQRIPANACCLDTIPAVRLAEHYELLDGRYKNEHDFQAAPPAFLRFARQQWRRWSVEDKFEQL